MWALLGSAVSGQAGTWGWPQPGPGVSPEAELR